MNIIQITPYGFTTPGTPCLVCDDPDYGQRLWFLAQDEMEVMFPYGPDWMNLAWLDRDFWPLGWQRVNGIGSAPGMLVIIDLFNPKTKTFLDFPFEGNGAQQVCDILTPLSKNKIGELWAVDPKGDISCGLFSFSLDAASQWNIVPFAYHQR